MPAAELNIDIEQGATWTQLLTWKTSAAGDPVDLTGYTARMHLRQKVSSPGTILELTTENGGITLGGVAGTILLIITATQTASITAKAAVYDLELVRTSDEYVTRVVEGRVVISPEVTR